MQALHRKLSMIYMEKFTKFFPDDDTVEDWLQTWGEAMYDLTGEEIKHGLEVLARDYAWPPTMADEKILYSGKPRDMERPALISSKSSSGGTPFSRH